MSKRNSGNTWTNTFFDTPAPGSPCEDEAKKIEENCKPGKDNDSNSDLAKFFKKYDAEGKERFKFIPRETNQWITDHCDGLWKKPYFVNKETRNLIQKDISEFLREKGIKSLKEKFGDKIVEVEILNKEENPSKAYTNLMSLQASLNPCIQARRCQLVQFKSAKSKTGKGCCPGQTAHHLIPDAAVKNAGCVNYVYENALTICLEGTSHHSGLGTHGNTHHNLGEELDFYRIRKNASGINPNKIGYKLMAYYAVRSVRNSGAATNCSAVCLMAQLNSHYNCPNELDVNDGTGGSNSGDQSLAKNSDEDNF